MSEVAPRAPGPGGVEDSFAVRPESEPSPDEQPLAALPGPSDDQPLAALPGPSDDQPLAALPEPGDDEEPLIAPPERLRSFLTRPRMFVGFALSIMTTVLIVRLFSLHLTHDFVIVRSHTREPEFLVYAALCVVGYLAADAAALVLLARVHGPRLPVRPLLLLSLRANFVGGTTSFGGVEIPYQALSLRRQGLTLPQATAVILVKGVVHTSMLLLVALVALVPASGSPITPLQRWIVGGALCAVALAWVAGSLWVRRPIGLKQLPARFHQHVHAVREAFGEYHKAGWRLWAGVALATLLYWAAMFAIIPLILIGLGWHGRPFEIVTGQAVLQVIMPLSPLAGGAGVAELGYIALIGPAAAVTIRVPSLVLWRIATWFLPVALGGAAFLVRSGSAAGGAAAAAPPAAEASFNAPQNPAGGPST